MCSKREPFHALLPLLRHVVLLNDGNCRLTMPVGKGRCARDALPHAFHIGVFEFVFYDFDRNKTYLHESAYIIEGCDVVCHAVNTTAGKAVWVFVSGGL